VNALFRGSSSSWQQQREAEEQGREAHLPTVTMRRPRVTNA
jgi:hypothetical protein